MKCVKCIIKTAASTGPQHTSYVEDDCPSDAPEQECGPSQRTQNE